MNKWILDIEVNSGEYITEVSITSNDLKIIPHSKIPFENRYDKAYYNELSGEIYTNRTNILVDGISITFDEPIEYVYLNGTRIDFSDLII